MLPIVERLPRHARILVVRLRSLGDCVLSTPALELLKRQRPDLRLAVMVERRFAGVYESNPDIDDILSPTLSAAAGFRPQLTLNLHGGTRSTLLTAASLAGWRAAYGHFRGQWLYNIHIPRAQAILGEERKVHTAEHVASAMFYLGVPPAEIPRARLHAARPEPPSVVIHPTASTPEKAWPADRFAAIARHLAGVGLRVVVIGSASDDLSAFSAFDCRHGAPLGEIKNLLAGASLFVGNDSGPAHMAAAFGVPVVVLYGASDPVIWAPWRTAAQVLVAPAGLATIPASQVLAAIDKLQGARQ